MSGYGFGAAKARRGHLRVASGGVAAPMSSISADGWRAQWATTPSIASPSPFTVARQGFDSAGNAVTIGETMYGTTRVRQVYPNQGSLTAADVALNDYLLATDTIAGVTNNSAETSPAVIANFVTPDRQLVGNSIGGSAMPIELVAFHYYMRAGKQVAVVKFLISDGTTTIPVLVSTPTVSPRATDQNAVIVYALPVTDISALTEGLITVNAEVYPHIGGAGSVLASAAVARSKAFSPRYFRKDVARAAAPPMVYVGAAGNNTTGVISTNAATAKATPFLTQSAAIDALQTAFGASGSGIDGCIIRIMAGGDIAWGSGAAVAKSQKISALIVERDPDEVMANVRLTFSTPRMRLGSGGTLVSPLSTGCIHIRNIRVQRTSTSAITGEAANNLEIFWEDVELDLNSHNSAYLANAHDYFYGGTMLNPAASAIATSANGEHRLWRGLNLPDTTGVRGFDGYLMVGCIIRRSGAMAGATILAFNKFFGIENLASPFGVTGADKACMQNIFEFVSATSASMTGITPDNASAGATNILFCNNSLAGFNDHGRSNHCYDEGATPRASKFIRQHGNIFVQLNCKGDVFVLDGTRIGNFAFKHGVGCTDNFTQFKSANGDPVGQGAGFAQDYAGSGAIFGISNTVRNDPLYTAPAATSSGSTGGIGGGTYTLQTGSPCKASATAMLSHDLAGNMRFLGALADSKGAYI